MFFLKLSFGLVFDNLDNQTKNYVYITLCTVHYTVHNTDHSLVYQKLWEGVGKREYLFESLTLIVQNSVLKILFVHSFCLHFAYHVCQTKKLKTVHILQCTLYMVHYGPYRPEFSTLKSSQERGHMGKMLLWLISRLDLISTLGKLDSIFAIYKNCY